jgi:hypothetical protein
VKESANPSISPGLPAAKRIRYQSGKLLYIDVWWTVPSSERSYGNTTIYHHGQPVWMMHYDGWHDGKIIQTVKNALFLAYSEKDFFGGRGPKLYEDVMRFGKISYNNDWIGNFENFQGREIVIDNRGLIAGEYNYAGHTL